MVTKADKSNSIVISSLDAYSKSVHELLDTNSFVGTGGKNNVKSLTVMSMALRWHRFMKLNKPDIPIHPIVSYIT